MSTDNFIFSMGNFRVHAIYCEDRNAWDWALPPDKILNKEGFTALNSAFRMLNQYDRYADLDPYEFLQKLFAP